MRNPLSSTRVRRLVFIAASLLPSILALGLLTFISGFSHRPPTKLMEAVRKNRVEEVKTLLARGVDVNERGTFGWTALWIAVDRGNVGLAKLLINAGANLNQRPDNGEPLFIRAAYVSWAGQAPELVELLLAHGANVHARTAYGGQTALHSAVILSNPTVVRTLIKAGLNVNASDCAGNVPLGLAVLGTEREPPRGNLEVIRQLLDAGARPPQHAVSRLRRLAAPDPRVLELLNRATVAVPVPYPGPCRPSPPAPSEKVQALKAWGDQHRLSLPYALWEFVSGVPFSLLIWFSTPAVLLLLATISRDRVLVLWSGGLLLIILVMLHIWLMLALITD